jgi:hypothetical protein
MALGPRARERDAGPLNGLQQRGYRVDGGEGVEPCVHSYKPAFGRMV